MGRLVVHLDESPKDKSMAKILQDFQKRLISRGITLQVHNCKNDITGYENTIASLSGRINLLDETGIQMSSQEFADWLKSTQVERENTHLAVGPHNGFSENLKESADKIISLSSLTLTHEMSAILLMEQLYRGTEIIRGTSYHRK
tara:strand:+ start:37 stop:471 length:435 start_codon:yes stop_codon:yes gene_type:complete